jgi:hypothetical protein
MALIDRAKNIIMSPATEWPVIATENSTIPGIYTSYVMPLAAIGPIATFLGLMTMGGALGFMRAYAPSFLGGLATMIVSYVLGLVGVYVIALIINALAVTFGGTKDMLAAFKAAAYAFTPAWIAGILHLVPLLGILGLLAGLYGLYLLYLGLPVLMHAPKEKAVGYTVVVVVCSIVLMWIIGAVGVAVGGLGMFGGGLYASGGGFHSNSVVVNGGPSLGSVTVQGQSAQSTANTQAQVNAATNALAALAAGAGSDVEPVDQNLLKAMLPETAGGLPRTAFEAEKSAVATFKVSKAQATYNNDQGNRIELNITDMGGTKALGMLAIWSSVEMDKENDQGYEKTGKADGRPTLEKFQKSGPQSEYSVVVGQRFLVNGVGQKVDMDTLKSAVNSIDLGKLDAMKGEGVKTGG